MVPQSGKRWILQGHAEEAMSEAHVLCECWSRRLGSVLGSLWWQWSAEVREQRPPTAGRDEWGLSALAPATPPHWRCVASWLGVQKHGWWLVLMQQRARM